VASGEIIEKRDHDWGAHFGPLDATSYFPSSIRFQQNPTLLLKAHRVFGDGIHAFIVSDFKGQTQHVLEFLPGWEIDIGARSSLSLNGKFIAAYLISPTGNRELQVYSVEGDFIGGYKRPKDNFIWLSDGRLMATSGARDLEIMNPFAPEGFSGGKFISIPESVPGVIRGWDLSPDESTLGFIMINPGPADYQDSVVYSLHLLNLETGAARLVGRGRPAIANISRLFFPFWSYDGKWIGAFYGHDDNATYLLAIPTDKDKVLVLDSDSDKHSEEVVRLKSTYAHGFQTGRYNWVPRSN